MIATEIRFFSTSLSFKPSARRLVSYHVCMPSNIFIPKLVSFDQDNEVVLMLLNKLSQPVTFMRDNWETIENTSLR